MSSPDSGPDRKAPRKINPDEMLAAALAYASARIPIFPVGRNRMPLVSGGHGHKDATCDPETIKRWWAAYPQAQIGMPTGSASGFDALDLDRKHGKDGTLKLPQWKTLTPLRVRTQSGGIHLYFIASGRLRSTSDYIAKGVDTRGENAYVLIPPSNGYEFIGEMTLLDVRQNQGSSLALGLQSSTLPDYPESVLELPVVFDHNKPMIGIAEDYEEISPGLFLFMARQIPNDENVAWDAWNDTGMTFYAASNGADYGRSAFFAYSKRSPKYSWARTGERWEHYDKSSPPTQKSMGSFIFRVRQANPDWEKQLDVFTDQICNQAVDLAADCAALFSVPLEAVLGFEPAPPVPQVDVTAQGVPDSDLSTNREPSNPPRTKASSSTRTTSAAGSSGRVTTDRKATQSQAKTQEASGPVINPAPPNSESALADSFCRREGHRLRFVNLWGKWMLWDGKRWSEDNTLFVVHLVEEHCKNMAAAIANKAQKRQMTSARCIASVERLARANRIVAATSDQWDSDSWILNTPGGIVDLRSGVLREADATDYCTKMTAVAPWEADCPQWKAHLAKVMQEDEGLIVGLHRLFGYAICGSTEEDVLAFFHGSGGNGKTATINAVSLVLGDYHTKAPMETFTASANDRHPTELAGLRGARLVTAVETEQGKRWAEAKLKQLTGGDPIPARFMHQDFFTYQPQFTLIIAGNHKPKFNAVDAAIRRRIVLYPFKVKIENAEEVRDLEQRFLAEEGGAILQWMIDGCVAWQKAGLAVPAAALAATDEYLASEDTISNFFEDELRRDAEGKLFTKEIYDAFKRWAEARGEYIMSMRQFSTQFEEKADALGVRKPASGRINRSGAQGRGFEGLGFKDDEPA